MTRFLAVGLVALLTGCSTVQCSGLSVGTDIVLTAAHCVDGVTTVPGRLVRPEVVIGQTLTVVPSVPAGDCAARRAGVVLDISDNHALLDTYACFGNSGAPVYDSEGNLVGVLTALVSSTHRAVVELL